MLKLRGGALQLTLFIIVVIALLLTSFILLVHTHKQFQVQTDFIIETTRNTNIGVDYALQNSISLNDTISIDLKDEDFKSIKVLRDYWGVFEKITVVSQIKNNQFKKTALIGAKQIENNRTALYTQNNNKPLVLVGNTKIEGVTYLPSQGVKSGTISRQSYYGSQLIYGQTKTASSLPKVLTETVNELKNIESKVGKVQSNQFLEIEIGKHYNNSFFKPTQLIFSNSTINLRGIELTGNILVQSKSKIVVYASSILKDVVLVAPEIEIQNNVKGNFQAIASKRINVGKSVKLQYPSVLVINEKEGLTKEQESNKPIKQNRISIDDNSIIKGLVFYLGEKKSNNYKTQVELNEKAILIGELYCNQNTELKGTVYGTVYSNNFIANQFGSVYQNHIYNGTIIVNKLPKEYVGLPFNNSKKEILKWLY
ncbi:hypothetical protein [Lacinutrix sp.]|uniref:hypothetical protein n=1 Tax=Lacinutrix sp. TaxID=1937692 RepID=UPI0025BF9CAA|nr:hypothetical protein [Lacinutrix sp.]